jgi:long-chain fatty acid transport protein
MNMIGFGAESMGMGGADLAIADDTSAMNTNPAGLAQIRDQRADLYAAALFAINVRHRDAFGNDRGVDNSPIPLASAGYARHLPGSPLVLGLGLFAQGGAGYEYQGLNTPFGTRDELSSLFRIAKLTPSLAWAVTGRLSLGTSLGIFYADIDQKVFPATSYSDQNDPAGSFFGYHLKDADVVEPGGKFGMQYRLSERLAIGASYTTQTALDLEGGDLTVNYSAIGLGSVRYHDVELKGLKQPREVGLGIAFTPAPRLMLAADLSWLDWSSAVKTTTLQASKPADPAAPPVVLIRTVQGWDDQYVLALGLRYEAGSRWTLRAGYNHGNNPIPDDNLNPLLAVITEQIVTLGAGYRGGHRWRIDTALEYKLNKTVEYDNPQLPFGPGAEEENEVLGLHLMFSYLW